MVKLCLDPEYLMVAAEQAVRTDAPERPADRHVTTAEEGAAVADVRSHPTEDQVGGADESAKPTSTGVNIASQNAKRDQESAAVEDTLSPKPKGEAP
jgi:hypothetical protein